MLANVGCEELANKEYSSFTANEVISELRLREIEDSFQAVDNSFLLDDDTSIPFSGLVTCVDDARYSLNGRDFDGSHIVVEFAKGAPRGGGGGDRDYRDGGDRGGSHDFLAGVLLLQDQGVLWT